MILCDTAHKIGTTDSWNTRIATVEQDGIEAIADAVLKRGSPLPSILRAHADLAGYRNMLIRQPVAGYVGTCAAVRDADFTEAARHIAVPTLCIVGDQDGSTPPDLVRSLAEPDSRRALRDDPRCRPHPLHRAARGADHPDPRLYRIACLERKQPMDEVASNERDRYRAGLTVRRQCSAIAMSIGPRRGHRFRPALSGPDHRGAPGARSGRARA